MIVEGPTLPATIQCFRLYGADLVSAPIDGQGGEDRFIERPIAEHRPKLVYLTPHLRNPSGAMPSPERRRSGALELAAGTRR